MHSRALSHVSVASYIQESSHQAPTSTLTECHALITKRQKNRVKDLSLLLLENPIHQIASVVQELIKLHRGVKRPCGKIPEKARIVVAATLRCTLLLRDGKYNNREIIRLVEIIGPYLKNIRVSQRDKDFMASTRKIARRNLLDIFETLDLGISNNSYARYLQGEIEEPTDEANHFLAAPRKTCVYPIRKGNKYEGWVECSPVERRIGRGGFGDILTAAVYQKNKGVFLAVTKGVLTNREKRTNSFKELEEEQIIFSQVNPHPNIVKYFGFFRPRGSPFYKLVFERALGETLHHFLERETKLNFIHVSLILAQILHGVLSLHNDGICHRDLKPKNILIQNPIQSLENLKTKGLFKITDLGLACSIQAAAHTWQTEPRDLYAGTHGFMPYEIALLQNRYDNIAMLCKDDKNFHFDATKVDAYALGKIGFFLILGTKDIKKFIDQLPKHPSSEEQEPLAYWDLRTKDKARHQFLSVSSVETLASYNPKIPLTCVSLLFNCLLRYQCQRKSVESLLRYFEQQSLL